MDINHNTSLWPSLLSDVTEDTYRHPITHQPDRLLITVGIISMQSTTMKRCLSLLVVLLYSYFHKLLQLRKSWDKNPAHSDSTAIRVKNSPTLAPHLCPAQEGHLSHQKEKKNPTQHLRCSQIHFKLRNLYSVLPEDTKFKLPPSLFSSTPSCSDSCDTGSRRLRSVPHCSPERPQRGREKANKHV